MSLKKVWLLLIVLFIGSGSIRAIDSVNAAGAGSLRLGVNDKLTTIEAVSVKDTYYVPLRELSQELKLTLTGVSDGIKVTGQNRSIKLLNDHATATLSDGKTISMNTFLKNGKTMVPLKLTSYLGFGISFKADQNLLRVKDGSATLDDATFVSKFKKEMKPTATPGTSTPTVGKQGKTVYLTFDDGPTATTSTLLDILAKYDAKATFFMIGPNMNQHTTQVKRIANEGHGLALHGMTHRKEKFYASPAAALGEMDNDNAILKKITGQSTTLIRPPYGSKPYFTKTFRDKVLAQGYHLWDWNVDSEDWKYKDASTTIYNSVMNQVHKLQKSQTNPVILMHDQKATLKVLPRILESLKKEGYTFHVISSDLKPLNFWKDTR
ncbi:polysaccharide deacetylase family protein [Paenibacillus sp. FSL P2-0536]|uniref:polysaccharide deacetylase n=1 Tax=Paenibacillus sp. FSL P2-0536 TaxID=2921629 RepID=UPI0030FD05D7